MMDAPRHDSSCGTVFLVGAGPGAPDLLTLRAARLLARADIVFHDALVHRATLALATRATLVPVGKRCGRHSTVQRFINKRLVDATREHAVVVRLKGGDPMLFGRAQEEITALEAGGVPYEVVPGVTSALAAAAQVGTSLTQRGSVRSVAFVTPRVGVGEEAAAGWLGALEAADAGAVYMGAGECTALAAALIAAGKPGALPVALVESATFDGGRTVYTTLAGLANAGTASFDGPVMLLVGPQFHPRARAVASSVVPSPAAAGSDGGTGPEPFARAADPLRRRAVG